MLHVPCDESAIFCQNPQSNLADAGTSEDKIHKVIEDSLKKLQGNLATGKGCIRWELGPCWVQHLQKREAPTDENAKNQKGDNKVEPAVKGLGKQFKMLKKREKKNVSNVSGANERNHIGSSNLYEESDIELKSCEPNAELLKYVSEEALSRLKEAGFGFHMKVTVHS